MSTVNDTDLLLVERNGTQYQITIDEMSTLNDDDLLLVERGGVQYKIEAQYVSTGPDGLILPPVEVLTPVNGAGLNEGDPYSPISSAFVTEDTTPIYFRFWDNSMTVISGGSVNNQNNLFDGDTSTSAWVGNSADAVSQAVYNNLPSGALFGGREGETVVYAYAYGGGSIEVLDDDGTTVLRTYALPASNTSTSIGIVRFNDKIRFTTASVNTDLYLCHITISGGYHQDFINEVNNNPLTAFQFTDDTDLDKMVAPIIMTDENGNVKVPTTSTVDSTTSIPGEKKGAYLEFTGNGTNKNYAAGPGTYSAVVGPRMTWTKSNESFPGAITDNVALGGGEYLVTSTTNGSSSNGPVLDENSSTYPPSGFWNQQYKTNYIAEIGVAPKVLDIITYVGTDANQEIPHSLGTKPGMIIVKAISASSNWTVWHTGLVASKFLRLDSSDGEMGNYNRFFSEPTADNIYIGNSGTLNSTGTTYVAYVFAADSPGKVHCGSYVGNGNTGGNDIYIDGATPGGFLLIKRNDSAGDWVATTKNASDDNRWWIPNTGVDMQGTSSNYVDFLPNNGFSLIGSNNYFNASGGQYVYLYISAALTGPNSTQLNLLSGQDLEYFTTGTEITSNLSASGSNISFASDILHGNNNPTQNVFPNVGGSYFFDINASSGNKWMTWIKNYTNAYGWRMYDSERNFKEYLRSNDYGAESIDMDGIMGPNGTNGYLLGLANDLRGSGMSTITFNFKAAREFFDVQKYLGNGNTQTISHDLGVEPGFIMTKKLSGSGDWYCYHHELGSNGYIKLNDNSVFVTSSLFGGSSGEFSDSNFTVAYNYTNMHNEDYISYIFAKDTPYVKCGKYTASGGGTSVDVGFKPRWVMIKSITNGYDWMMLDKDLPSNKTLSPNTYSQSVALNNGYTFTSNGFSFGGSDLETNNSGHEYIYVAIADESEGHPPNFPSSSTVTETPDPATATMVVNAESFDVGDTASGAALNASITSVFSTEGNSLIVDSSTGTWLPGLYAKGSEITVSAPSADEITFTSRNASTTPFSGVDATLSSRTWTLESGPSATGPWTVVDTYVDYDAMASQDGSTPWSSNKPALTADTFYRVKVQYDSTNAESVESVYHTFKTGAS